MTCAQDCVQWLPPTQERWFLESRPSMVSDLARPWEPALYEPEATCFPACPELVSHMDQGQQATGQALGEVRGNRARG